MNLQNQRIYDGRVIKRKPEPDAPEKQLTHTLTGVAVAAGVAGLAFAATAVVWEIPLAMGLAAGLTVLGATAGLKGLRLSYKSNLLSEKRSGISDRRSHAEQHELASIR